MPHATGGGNWEGGAVDPETGMLYVSSVTNPYVYGLRVPDPERTNLDYWATGRAPQLARGIPVVKPPWGRITAIDLNSGEHAWMIPNGETPENVANHPLFEGVDLPQTGTSSRATLLVTKTLLFSGEGSGGAPVLRAHDKATGAVVAEIELPATATGIPMSYMYGGRQYIVVGVGGRGYPAGLVALTLPE